MKQIMSCFRKSFLFFGIPIFIYSFLFFTSVTHAANLSFSPERKEANVGDQFEIQWIVNTENETVNAFSGKIVYFPEMIQVDDIRIGNSVVNMWVERPKADAHTGSISFSGIIPGGIKTQHGLVFSLVITALKPGESPAVLLPKDVQILLNDGKGTGAPISLGSFSLVARNRSGGEPTKVVSQDIFMPEAFTPSITRDPNLFNGKYFLIFLTQDKETGIAKYEVCEGSRQCVQATSPYLLQNQNLTDEITVKAYDANRNQRIAKISPSQKEISSQNYSWYTFIILLFILILGITTNVVLKIRKKK